MQLLLAQINPTVGDIPSNQQKIIQAICLAKEKNLDCVVFPELSLSGYPPQDLLYDFSYLVALEKALQEIAAVCTDIMALVGTVRHVGTNCANSAAIIVDGEIEAYYDKILLPDYDVFNEKRYFVSGNTVKVLEWKNCRFAVTICEDIWSKSFLQEGPSYGCDPIKVLEKEKLDLLINLSASPYTWEKSDLRLSIAKKVAKRLDCAVCLCNQVGGNDGLIFDGQSFVVDAQGRLKVLGKAFEEEMISINHIPQTSIIWNHNPIQEVHDALILGMRDYFNKQGFTKAILGISGGIDSAVVAYLATAALGQERVLGLAMPSRFSSSQSEKDAQDLAQNLKIRLQTISIEPCFEALLKTCAPFFHKNTFDITEENIQSRIRGLILMAFSNQYGYLVLNCGNKSELAMGYATLYGDTCGALAVIGDLPKKRVYELASWINRNTMYIPQSIVEKEPSAELKENQKDSDTLPPYAVIDEVIERYIHEGRSLEEVVVLTQLERKLVHRIICAIHAAEYKRRQSPLALKVFNKSFTCGRHIPIVHRWDR